jgi:hypothetical protein
MFGCIAKSYWYTDFVWHTIFDKQHQIVKKHFACQNKFITISPYSLTLIQNSAHATICAYELVFRYTTNAQYMRWSWTKVCAAVQRKRNAVNIDLLVSLYFHSSAHLNMLYL